MTCICGHHQAVHQAMCGSPEGCDCNRFVAARQEPEPLVIPVEWFETHDRPDWTPSKVSRITITPDIARRLVAMGQTTTEGR